LQHCLSAHNLLKRKSLKTVLPISWLFNIWLTIKGIDGSTSSIQNEVARLFPGAREATFVVVSVEVATIALPSFWLPTNTEKVNTFTRNWGAVFLK